MSKIFLIDKAKNFNEWYNEVIRRANIIDDTYGAKGFYVKKPLGMFAIERIRDFFEHEFQSTGHLPVHFPTLIPEKNFEAEKAHVSGFIPEVFWVTRAGSEVKEFSEKLALKPTGETAIYPSYSKWIRSYRDLPLKLYQFGTVFRYDTKETRPLIREREFIWFETHNVFPNEEEALEQVKEDAKIMQKIVFEKLGIPFLCLKRPQWDKFPGANDTFAFDTILGSNTALQIGSTHLLGQNFAKAFNIRFENEKNLKQYVHQTCFGPGVSRILSALISVHGDEKGLILPFDVALLQVIIIPIPDHKNAQKILNKAMELEKLLNQNGIRAKADLSDKTPGEKFNLWELYGVPVRIELGSKELEKNKLTFVLRHNREKEESDLGNLAEKIRNSAVKMLQDLKERAMENLQKKIKSASDLDDVEILLEAGFVVKAPFCSIDEDGKDCGEKIKERFKASVRGSEFLYRTKVQNRKCVVCGNEAKEIVYIAKEF
jgi:prolyl-tRNA synthetase